MVCYLSQGEERSRLQRKVIFFREAIDEAILEVKSIHPSLFEKLAICGLLVVSACYERIGRAYFKRLSSGVLGMLGKVMRRTTSSEALQMEMVAQR